VAAPERRLAHVCFPCRRGSRAPRYVAPPPLLPSGAALRPGGAAWPVLVVAV